MTDNASILSQLNRYFTVNGTAHVNPQGLVDVYGDVHVDDQPNGKLSVAFGHVTGSFLAFQTNLRTLMGSPQKVDETFDCGRTRITSLEGGPQEVGENYHAHLNKLTHLTGAPQSVGGTLVITYHAATPLFKLFNYKKVEFLGPVPQIWQDLFNPEKHPELQGGGRMAQIKAVAMLTKAGLYKNNPNAKL